MLQNEDITLGLPFTKITRLDFDTNTYSQLYAINSQTTKNRSFVYEIIIGKAGKAESDVRFTLPTARCENLDALT